MDWGGAISAPFSFLFLFGGGLDFERKTWQTEERG